MSTKEKTKLYFSPCYDSTFKYLYKNKYLRGFFNNIIYDYTKLKLDDYQLIDNEFNFGYNKNDKRLDLLLEKKCGDKVFFVDIEMNQFPSKALEKKNDTYLYSLALDIYNQYDDIDIYLYQVNINKGYHKKGYISERIEFKNHKNDIIGKNIIIFNIYLEQKEKKGYSISEERFKIFFTEKYSDLDNIKIESEVLERMKKEIRRLNDNPKFISSWDEERANRKFYKDYAREKSKETSLAVAKNMLKKHMNINLISELTNLPINDINKLNI